MNPENIAGQGFHTNPERINKAGKPPGTLSRKTIYRKWMEVMDQTGMTEADKIVLAAIKKALEGDVPAIKECFDSVDGKIKEELQHTVTKSLEITKAGQAVLDAEREKMLYEVRKQIEQENIEKEKNNG